MWAVCGAIFSRQGNEGLFADGQARVSPGLETLNASMKVSNPDATGALLSLTATGEVGAPSVRLKGSWLRAQ
jgi:hypothetical protein